MFFLFPCSLALVCASSIPFLVPPTPLAFVIRPRPQVLVPNFGTILGSQGLQYDELHLAAWNSEKHGVVTVGRTRYQRDVVQEPRVLKKVARLDDFVGAPDFSLLETRNRQIYIRRWTRLTVEIITVTSRASCYIDCFTVSWKWFVNEFLRTKRSGKFLYEIPMVEVNIFNISVFYWHDIYRCHDQRTRLTCKVKE